MPFCGRWIWARPSLSGTLSGQTVQGILNDGGSTSVDELKSGGVVDAQEKVDDVELLSSQGVNDTLNEILLIDGSDPLGW